MTNQALSTTEELIVQYLDGELVRKELEMVLFERLATSEEARFLLREHLTMRGAIRMSGEDDRFVLSSDLDNRTRTRLETMLESMTPAPVPMILEDHPAIAIQPATRSMKRFAVRPAYAALLLLLAIGSTWFLTRPMGTAQLAEAPKPAATQEQALSGTPAKTDVASAMPSAAMPSAAMPSTAMPTSTTPSAMTGSGTATGTEPKVIVKEVVRYIPASTASTPSTAATQTELASNNQPDKTTATDAKPAEPAADPAEMMMSRRLPKLIKALESKEITITDRDRL